MPDETEADKTKPLKTRLPLERCRQRRRDRVTSFRVPGGLKWQLRSDFGFQSCTDNNLIKEGERY